jgi:hypothetical protein
MNIYWCEFPEKCDWNRINEWTKDHKITTYITCTSREDFEEKKKNIQKICKNIEINAWPILPKEKGYWFSSFTDKEDIDSLDQYKGLKIKLDIEPPIPKDYSFTSTFKWLILSLLKHPKNRKYFQNKIIQLTKNTDIILSTFPFPKFILKQWGYLENHDLQYNFMHYSTFFPKWLRPVYNLYYKQFFKTIPKDSYIAIGLIGPGIFGNEPIYKNINELQQDIQFLKQNSKTNLVFFNLESLSYKKRIWFKQD